MAIDGQLKQCFEHTLRVPCPSGRSPPTCELLGQLQSSAPMFCSLEPRETLRRGASRLHGIMLEMCDASSLAFLRTCCCGNEVTSWHPQS